MQNPGQLKEAFVKWRKLQLRTQLENDLTLQEADKKRISLEVQFLSTLDFYDGVKEKVLRPLIDMQVIIFLISPGIIPRNLMRFN